MKVYGDTLFQLRNHEPVNNTFAAAHLDLFVTADLERLSFLSEVFFEADGNEMAVDIERLQVSYLVNNWLRLRAGRTHTAYGYYNDTYHHGNLFELTTARPFTAQFEDNGGLLTAHLVGVGIDGTFETGIGALRYDLEVGNGRLADTTAVAVLSADKNQKLVNLRLRLVLDNGFTIGINGLMDKVPVLRADDGSVERPSLQEKIAGVHLVYMENGVHALVEGSLIHHEPGSGPSTNTMSVFGELGYAIGYVTPYVRYEWIHFPRSGDPLYQEASSFYADTQTLTDLRIGLNYRPMQALALKLEGERLGRAGYHQELLTAKAAFGF